MLFVQYVKKVDGDITQPRSQRKMGSLAIARPLRLNTNKNQRLVHPILSQTRTKKLQSQAFQLLKKMHTVHCLMQLKPLEIPLVSYWDTSNLRLAHVMGTAQEASRCSISVMELLAQI